MIKCSVIIPVYKDWNRLQYCIDALTDQTIDNDEYEVLVINNEKTMKNAGSVNLPDNTIILHQPIPGSYAARNRGVEKAKGRILAFTDSDCVPEENWLKAGINSLEDEVGHLIGGKIDIFRSSSGSRVAFMYDKRTAFKQEYNISNGNGVTANLFLNKDLFLKLGGFNSKIKSGGDWEFTQRAVNRGYDLVYDEKIKVYHPARESVFKIMRKHYRNICWGMINTKRKNNHYTARIMISQIKSSHKKIVRNVESGNKMSENVIIIFINLMKVKFRLMIYMIMLLGIINPDEVRK